jgi:protein-disulfide isomerase
MTKKLFLGLSLLILIVLSISATFIYINSLADSSYYSEKQSILDTRSALLAVTDSDFLYGNADAPIKLVIYSDSVCHYCRALYPKLIDLANIYPNDIAVVYRPVLLTYRKRAYETTDLLLPCLGESSSSMQVHRYISSLMTLLPSGYTLPTIPTTTVETALRNQGDSLENYSDCLQSDTTRAKLLTIDQNAGLLGVRGLPHTFVVYNGTSHEFLGNRSSEIYLSSIETLLGRPLTK